MPSYESRSASRPKDALALRQTAFYAALRDVLRDKEGFDLDAYRPAFLARRLDARMGAVGEDAGGYARLVDRDAGERRALLETLGVNVTSFFRDPAVWEFLDQVALPPLVEERSLAGRDLLAVSLGCAGGQEPYSLAMLLAELTGSDEGGFRVDAYDADPAAVATAGAALYPPEAVQALSAAARARYFEPAEGGSMQRVSAGLRARVRVVRRDILTEPLGGPYDVVLCRNVIIYLEAEGKDALLRRIHEAMAPGAILVLGQSEGMHGPTAARFRPLSLRERIYARST